MISEFELRLNGAAIMLTCELANSLSEDAVNDKSLEDFCENEISKYIYMTKENYVKLTAMLSVAVLVASNSREDCGGQLYSKDLFAIGHDVSNFLRHHAIDCHIRTGTQPVEKVN